MKVGKHNRQQNSGRLPRALYDEMAEKLRNLATDEAVYVDELRDLCNPRSAIHTAMATRGLTGVRLTKCREQEGCYWVWVSR